MTGFNYVSQTPQSTDTYETQLTCDSSLLDEFSRLCI